MQIAGLSGHDGRLFSPVVPRTQTICRLDFISAKARQYLPQGMNLRLTLRYLIFLGLFVSVGCGAKSKNQIVGEASAEQSPSPSPAAISRQTPTPSPPNTPSPPVKAEQIPAVGPSSLESRVRPAIIWISVFDPSGKLLRTQTGFFISADGKVVTTVRTIEGATNAVAKTGDGAIYNVSGILTASSEQDLAILQADVNHVSFLTLNTAAKPSSGASVIVVGSRLAGTDGAAREATISTEGPNRLEIATPVSQNSIGAPVVDTNGEVVGVVVSDGEKAMVRTSGKIEELLGEIASNATPKWPEKAQTRPTPKPTAKPRLVYAPAPSFPPQLSRPGVSGSGRFRLTFDTRGSVTNVQIVQSTGNGLFDQAAINTFRHWKSAPGQDGVVTVPITFRSR